VLLLLLKMGSQYPYDIPHTVSQETFQNYREGECLEEARPTGTGGGRDVTHQEYEMRHMTNDFSNLLHQAIHFQPRK
jgi:hypothetical protein